MTDTGTQQEKKHELATRPSALMVMANKLNVEPQKLLQTLKDTVFKGANDSELITLVVVANEYGLNPLLKEIYAFPAKGGGITPVVSIDGWISMVNRQAQLDGLEFDWVGGELPESCTCTIHIKNRSHPVRITEFYKECFRATDPWKQMPRRMLRHKALKEAARVAFGFSGITDEDEARDIIKNADARIIEPKAFPPPRRVEKPDFTPSKPEPTEDLGASTWPGKSVEQEPPPMKHPITSIEVKEKAKAAAKAKAVAEAPQTRLFGQLSQAQINQTDFIEGLKLINFQGLAEDTELVHELSNETCEAILSQGLSQIMDEIQAAKDWDKVSK
jgi:phage recombination protein Bet